MDCSFEWTERETKLFENYYFDEDENSSMRRTRRVTINEIIDDCDDFDLAEFFEENDTQDEQDIEEVFQSITDLVDNWKSKLELIVAEGLKKMRKSSKEKKLMMQYLPGTKMVGAAREEILMQWRGEFLKSLGSTQKKLDKLTIGTIKEAEQTTLASKKKSERPDLNKNKKKLIHIECPSDSEGTGTSINQLIRNLNDMCQRLGKEDNHLFHNIPIFPQESSLKKQLVPVASQNQLQRLQSLISATQPVPDTRLIGDIYAELESKQAMEGVTDTRKSKSSKKDSKLAETNVVKAQKRMANRKLKKEQDRVNFGKFRLREFTRNGKERILLVKKREKSYEPVEEIFTEWKENLTPKIPAKLASRRRVRKISHRAQRKALLKETTPSTKPLLYSDALKRNLKLSGYTPIEDIFEAWRDYLQELDDLLHSDESGSSTPEPYLPVKTVKLINLPREVIFASWRHNLDIEAKKTEQRLKTFPFENYFAAWRHNLNSTSPRSVRKPLDPEEIFSSWRKNLEIQLELEVNYEDLFFDWIPNLNEDYDSEDKMFHPDNHRLVKNQKKHMKKTHNYKRKRAF